MTHRFILAMVTATLLGDPTTALAAARKTRPPGGRVATSGPKAKRGEKLQAQPARPLGQDPGLPPDLAPLKGQKSSRLAWYRERYGSEEGPAFVDPTTRTLREAFIQQRLQVSAPAIRSGSGPQSAASLAWSHLGPMSFPSYPFGDATGKPGSGRVTGIYVNAVDPRLLYTFSEGAGLWRCRNADVDAPTAWTWERIGVGVVTSARPLWVNPQAPALLLFGKGRELYVSTDHGTTWSLRRTFSDTLVDFGSPDGSTLLAAAGTQGLWKSTDQGATWAQVTVPGATLVKGLLILDGGVILVHGGTAATSAAGTHIFRSTDAGATWTKATWTGTMADPAARPYPLAFLGGGQAAYVKPSGSMPLHRSDDGGLTWNPRPLEAGQADPGGLFAADPAQPDVLFANYFELNRSLDGGKTWTPFNTWAVRSDLPSIHADQHAGAFSLVGPRIYYSGNDGGVAAVKGYTLDPKELKARQGELIEMRMNAGLGNPLVYVVGATGADRNAWILGLQDHGTILGNGRWRGTGDGLSNKVHPTDPNKILSEGYGDNLSRSLDGGKTWSGARTGITTSNGWSTQLYLGTHPDTVYYTNSDGAWKSHDWAASWSAVPLPTMPAGWKLRGFAASASDDQRLAFTVRYADSWGYLTRNQGATWTPFGALPGALPWCITFHPQQAETLYTSSSTPSNGNRLFRSQDGGATWTPLDTAAAGWPSGAIPDVILVHPLVPSWLIVGTSFGILESRNDGQSWQVLGAGFPILQPTDMFLPPQGLWLRATTWGMGMWDLDLEPVVATYRPVLTTQPTSQSIPAGRAATFLVTATCPLNLSYQWKRNGVDIPGATSAAYATPVTTLADSGASFTVTVSSSAGSVTSGAALLTVTPPPPPSFDLNGDGTVDVFDVLGFLKRHGSQTAQDLALADFNQDGAVDDADLAALLAAL